MRRVLVASVLGVGMIPAAVIAVAIYETRIEYPQNPKFYSVILGSEVRPEKMLASCATAPWYGALDSAEFYAIELPDAAFTGAPDGYPRKLDYQKSHDTIGWHGGPASVFDQSVLAEGVQVASDWLEQEGSCSSLDETVLRSIPSILDRPDVRLAYVYRKDFGHVNRLALYLLDPKRKVFYLLRYGI